MSVVGNPGGCCTHAFVPVSQICRQAGVAIPVDRFRGNLVLHGGAAFAEDGWTRVRVAGQTFAVLGACQRCQMVCIDQRTGERTAEPLATLAVSRKFNVRGAGGGAAAADT